MCFRSQLIFYLYVLILRKFADRMHPRQHEPTPVMRSHMVSVNDVITGINGMPMLGFDTTVVANVLQNLPACVTMRLVKYGAEFVPAIARTQVSMQAASAPGFLLRRRRLYEGCTVGQRNGDFFMSNSGRMETLRA